MSYSSQRLQAIHLEAVEFIKSCKGLIKDQHRTDGLIQLTHVGVYQQCSDSKNPHLVGLIDGMLISINRLEIDLLDGKVENVMLSRDSVGGSLENEDLSMVERIALYNKEIESLPTTGKFLDFIRVN